MTLQWLINWALDKAKFNYLEDYSVFCKEYLSFIHSGLQAVIVSKNENVYRFFQYKKDGNFNVSRPINTSLFLPINNFDKNFSEFSKSLKNIKDIKNDKDVRKLINSTIYTYQQSIGALLDALPAGQSNFARKLNGDLFERLILLLLERTGIQAVGGTTNIPVEVNGQKLFDMKYQHDLIVKKNDDIRAIGSVKTSSKDRIDKIFIDKFLHNKLTDTNTPHFAIFLNDVQRKGTEKNYGINTTFLTGHFKAYTVKLNPLDGVYYCDIRPNMVTEDILKDNIRTLDHLLVEDVWKFLA